MGEKAAPAEVHAGRELQHWIGRITGAYVPLLASEKDYDAELKVKLHVGCAAGRKFPKDLKAIGRTDGFAVRTVVEDGITHVYVFGSRPRGVLHAVYALLERNTDLIFARPDPVGTVWGDTDSLVLADAGIHAAQSGVVLFQTLRMKYFNDDCKNVPFKELKRREDSSIGGGRSRELQTFAELSLEL